MRLPGLWRPAGTPGVGYGGIAGGQNRHVHGDPAYPSEEALFGLLRHRSSPGAVAPDREELCRRLVTRTDLELEVCVPLAVVSAVPDFCPCRLDPEPHDADAVGWSER